MSTLKNLILLALMLTGTMAFSQTWNYASSTGTSYILYGMHFPSGQSDIGYACGMQYTYNAPGVITKTTDGGNNWVQIWPASGTIDGLQAIWFIDNNTGFAGGWNNYFIKTTDGGTTWTPVTVGTGIWYFTDIVFWDSNNGVAAAKMDPPGQAVFITSDGGNNWTQATSGINEDVLGLDYADANTLYAGGQGGTVFKSTDGGHNWTSLSVLGGILFGFDFADANFGIVGAEEKIFATNDGGASWTTHVTGYEHFWAAKAFTDGTGWAGGTDENIYKTTDYGVTWTMDHNGPGTSSLYRIRFTPDGDGIACGSQGTVLLFTPPFGAGFTADNTEICEGGTVNFTDNSTGTPISWSWTFEGGTPATSTLQNPSVTYPAAGTYDVTLEISDGSNTNTLVETDFILVEAIPAQAATPSGPSETCGGLSYDYSTTIISNADAYDWVVDPSSAGTITGTGETATFVASATWTGAYSVKVRAENECGSGPWSPVLSANLNHQPEQFQMLGTGGYCEGTAGLEPILDGSEVGVDYELYHDGASTGNIMAGTGSQLNFGFYTQTGFYTVEAFTASCSETMIGECYIFIQYPPAQPNQPTGQQEVCSGDVETYTTATVSQADTYTWTLEPPDAGTMVPVDETVEITWSGTFAGKATLTVAAANECGDGPVSDGLEVTVYAQPQPEITGLSEVCDEDIELYSTPEVSGNTYVWEVTGGTIVDGAGTNQIQVEWGAPGTGTVILTESNVSCEVTTEAFEVIIDDCTGLDELAAAGIRVYPNPVRELLTIDLDKSTDVNISVWSIDGRKVYERRVTSGTGTFTLNVDSFQVGIYNVRISTENNLMGNIKILVMD